MKQLEEYAAQANGCREAAAKAATPEVADQLLQMAERWEELARQRAAHLHLEDVLARLLKEHNHNCGAGAASTEAGMAGVTTACVFNREPQAAIASAQTPITASVKCERVTFRTIRALRDIVRRARAPDSS